MEIIFGNLPDVLSLRDSEILRTAEVASPRIHTFRHSVLYKYHTSHSLKLFYCSQKWRWATTRAMKTLRAKEWISSGSER
jgi:hypothetical protein